MAGGAEAGESEAGAVADAGQPQRAVAYCAGTQERRPLAGIEPIRKRDRESRGHPHVLRVPAVGIATGTAEFGAQVLATRTAPLALATGGVDPGHAETPADAGIDAGRGRGHLAHHFVARDHR